MQTKKTISAPYEGKLHVRCDEKAEETYLRIRRLCFTLPEAICEAASRPSMRFVSPKTIEQQDLQSLHRIRSLLIQERTAMANQLRGLLMEYGITFPQGVNKIVKTIPTILEDEELELSVLTRLFIRDLYEQIILKTKKIEEYGKLIEVEFKQSKDCQKIAKIEGVGVLTATALMACLVI